MSVQIYEKKGVYLYIDLNKEMNGNKRLESLDAFRGFDMMFIMGLSGLIVALCKLFPGGADCWLAGQFSHSAWNGLKVYDMIFPVFLFIAGVSFPFSYAGQCERGDSRGKIYLKIFRRALMLFALGLVYNGLFRLQFGTLRICSVLGRIGLAWMFAALLFINFKPGVRAAVAVALLVGFRLLCLIPAPDVAGADPLSREGCLAGYIDRIVLGPEHVYADGIFDPEGILCTMPAIVTAMLGMFTGELVRLPQARVSGGRKTLLMLGAAVVLLAAGLLWSRWFPVNKKLWSSTFVLVVGAYSLAMFAIFYWIIDVKGWKSWAFPFKVVGMNSITIYLAQKVISFKYTTDFLTGGLVAICPEQWGAVIAGLCRFGLAWLFLLFLYKHKIFLRV